MQDFAFRFHRFDKVEVNKAKKLNLYPPMKGYFSLLFNLGIIQIISKSMSSV